MGKGARHREAHKREQAQRAAYVRLYHGTAGVTAPYVKTRGMNAAEPAGLLLLEDLEDARPHALAATARMLQDGAEDDRGLIVEVELPPERLRPDPEAAGHWWVDGVRPGEVAGLHYFDATELEDGELLEDLAGVFDTDSQDWKRAGTGEMEP